MRYYLVAGEASGDLHGSNLMKELKKSDTMAEFRFFGGDLMKDVGGTLVSHYQDRAFMGLWEVIKNIGKILGFLKFAKSDLLQWKPDVLILIDNPGFNMRIASFAKKNGFIVHYYIAPKVWAWNTKRVKKIKKYVDYLYSILPFEPDFFSLHGVNAEYVGNPVFDALSQFVKKDNWIQNHGIKKPIIALLPGSRKNEIENTLPLLSSLKKDFSNYNFVVAGASGYSESYLRSFCPDPEIIICLNDTYNVLSNANAALVASGTATLETAAFGVPQLVCYRVAGLTYLIGKMLIKVKWVSLVNLIVNRELVKEYLQNDFNYENLKTELTNLLSVDGRKEILSGYDGLREKLGPVGASAKAAKLIFDRARR